MVLVGAAGFAIVLCAISSSPGFSQTKKPAGSAVTGIDAQFIAVTYAELPGWQHDDHLAAFKAFQKSCEIVIGASKAGNKGGATPTPPALLSACDVAIKLATKRVGATDARAFFEVQFTPHRVAHQGPAGLLTGYYEPLINGSRTQTAKFQSPIYSRPADLVNIVDESQRGAKDGTLTHGRKATLGIVPYATRAEIEQGALKGRGLELMYLADPVEAFFMQIQGSGRIKLPDGSMVRVSYDGKNGHPYTSVGRHLIDTGLFPADKMSLEALGAWLKADAERGRRAMWQNKSFVFFRELKGKEAEGALGVLHIPLTPGRSLAVDAGVHAIGMPVYVSAPTLTHAAKGSGFNRLMIAQDVGSAIKGPERGDLYFGSGTAAGKLAGITKHPGSMFVLLPRGTQPLPVSKPEASAAAVPPTALPAGSLSNRADP